MFDVNRDQKISLEESDRLTSYLKEVTLKNLKVIEADIERPLEHLATRATGVEGQIQSSHELSVDLAIKVRVAGDKEGRFRVEIRDWMGEDHEVRCVVGVERNIEVLTNSTGKYDKKKRSISGVSLKRDKSFVIGWRLKHVVKH